MPEYPQIDEVFREYKNRIYWLIFRIVRNESDAKDCLQNTFLNVIRNLKNFQGKAKLSTWIYKIAYNEALMWLRKKQRRQPMSLNIKYPSRIKDVPVFASSPKLADKELLDNELNDRIDNGVKSLPLKYRMPVLLRNFKELSTKDAAGILGLNLNSFKTRLRRAYSLLGEELKKYWEDKPEAVVSENSCKRELGFIYKYIEDGLNKKEKKAFKVHISDCPPCREFLNTYKKAIISTKSLQCPDIPLELEEKIKSFINANKREL